MALTTQAFRLGRWRCSGGLPSAQASGVRAGATRVAASRDPWTCKLAERRGDLKLPMEGGGEFGRISSMRSLTTFISAVSALAVVHAAAQAQLLDQLKGAAGGSTGSMLGGGMPSGGQAGAGNTAGVLEYCIKNKYLSGGSASSVKDSVLGKVSGQSNDSGYREGSNGMLQTGNGQGYSLGGGGIKAQITQKVCDQVLQHAKSF